MIRILFNPITIVLATLCIQWVALAEVGTWTVQVPYVALGIVMLYALSGPRKLAAAADYVRENALWVLPLAVYLLILTIILLDSPGQNLAPRQIFYLMGGISLAAAIATARRLAVIFRVGAALGLIFFVAFVEVLARRIGLSWFDAVTQFFSGGNLHFVVYSFFRAIFNSLDPAADVFGGSTKNRIAGCVLVLVLLLRSASAKPHKDISGILFMCLGLGLIVLLNTRSVMIAAVGSLVLAMAIGAVMRPTKNFVPLVLKMVALLTLFVIALQFSVPDAAVSGTLSDRFAFEDNSAAARLEQFRTAVERIERHPLTGSGYFEVNGHMIHNLFLGAWMHAGLIAFLLALAFYLALLARWVVTLVTVARRPERWVLPVAFEWIAPFPILPLFRVWISGDAGHFTLAEWIAISTFFGCVLANQLRRRAIASDVSGQRSAKALVSACAPPFSESLMKRRRARLG